MQHTKMVMHTDKIAQTEKKMWEILQRECLKCKRMHIIFS